MSSLPDHVHPLAADGSFCFHCHPGVPCFTECCRELELSLSPYDVLRLKQALGLTSQEFLDRYAIIEFAPEDNFPKVYLAMIDDGRASCPFVGPDGCQVYANRPAACRSYPLGRGCGLSAEGAVQEHFILVREPHCEGFAAARSQNISEWFADQEIAEYNRYADLLLSLLHGPGASPVARLSDEAAGFFIDTLYNLENFKAQPGLPFPLPKSESTLLAYAIDWLKHQWHSRP